jgi:hypothetical protein
MLDINNGGGEFTPWVKYNAKAGRWYVKGDNADVEVHNPVFVADFANIKTGWFYFSSGQAPERIMDPSLSQRADKPNRTFTDKNDKVQDCFKRGFALNLFSKAHFGGVVELASTSGAMAEPINALFTQYEAAPESKQGLLPVVAFKQANPVTGKHGTNYSPVFVIEKWVARPAELTGASAPVAANQSAPVAAASAPQVASVSEF